MTTFAFLSAIELRELTGFARASKQVDQLRRMGIPFWINGVGRPVVARAAIEGGKPVPEPKLWEPQWGGVRP